MGDAGTIITSSVNHFHNEVDDTTDTATNNLQRAEDVLEIAHELYARGDSRVKPNASSYTTVICGWAYHSNNRKQMREAGERAQRLLDVMEAAYNNKNNDDDDDNEDDVTVRISSMKPSVLTYSAVAMAWAVQAKSMANSSVSKDRGENAMVKAEQVLDRILELYEAGDEDMVSAIYKNQYIYIYIYLIQCYNNNKNRNGTSKRAPKSSPAGRSNPNAV